MTLIDQLLNIYKRLRNHFGFLNWWPGDTPFEVIIGAILTQNTAWTNVEKAIANLKEADVLTPEGILSLPLNELPTLLRPSGYFNQKAVRLRAISAWIMERCGGNLDKLNDIQTGELRLELLNINGIGPETADSILLYAFNRPVFVIDAYTRRAMARIGITDMNASYKELQELFENNLPEDVKLFNDFHAQFVMLGKYYCRVKTGCGGCPLEVVCLTMQLPGFDESGLRNC